MRMISVKEIFGGRIGVDRGALEAGFPYGGLAPKGRRSEDGCEAFARKDSSVCVSTGALKPVGA